MTEPMMSAIIYLAISMCCVVIYGLAYVLVQMTTPVPRPVEVVVRPSRRQ